MTSTWIPRSHYHLYEIRKGLDKVTDLTLDDIKLDETLEFMIHDYPGFPVVKYRQNSAGLFTLETEVTEGNIVDKARVFREEAQRIVLEYVFKHTQPITYRQITADMIPLDFHLAIIYSSEEGVTPSGSCSRKAGNLEFTYSPEELYSSGNEVYIRGSLEDDLRLLVMYRAYIELSCHFLHYMMRKVNRIYDEVNKVLLYLRESDEKDRINKASKWIHDSISEASQSYGRLNQALGNAYRIVEEYDSLELDDRQKETADTLKLEHDFDRLLDDGEYIHELWASTLMKYIENIDSSLDTELTKSRK